MMSQSEYNNNFNNEWQKAFKDASETPPPSIWQKLENQLDSEGIDKKIPLVWWKNPKIYYAAASVAVVLLAGLGILINLNPANEMNNFKGKDVAVTTEMQTPLQTEKSSGEVITESQDNPSQQVASAIAKNESVLAGESKRIVEASPSDLSENSSLTGSNALISPPPSTVQSEIAKNRSENESVVAITETSKNIASQESTLENKESVGVTPGDAALMSGVEIAMIDNSNMPWIEKTARFNKRLVFYRPELPEDEEELNPSTKKEYYAGAGIMPSMFNPNISIASEATTSMAFGKSSNSSVRQEAPTRSGVSYAMQTYGGIKLNKHWSIETGISYLKGNSVFESSGFVMDVMNVSASNALENALVTGSARVADKFYGHSLSNAPALNQSNSVYYYMDVKEDYQNNYSFIQLPVQAGFTIAPDHKLSYTVLGGMVGNLFLNNHLNLTSGGTLVTSISDGTYEPLHWSATSGLRLNYRLAENWSAMLTGSYQKAFYDAGGKAATIHFKPQLFGVGWGVKFNF